MKNSDISIKNILGLGSIILLSIIPIIILAIVVKIFAVNIPYCDMWDWIYVLKNYSANTLTFGDLIQQHNEHRLIFPYIIFIAMVNIGKWKVFHFSLLMIFLSFCTFLVFVDYIRKLANKLDDKRIFALVPLIAMILFSVTAGMNLIWCGQFLIYLNLFTAVLGLYLLSCFPFNNAIFITALISGIVSTYSFGNGIFYWLSGLFPLLYVLKGNKNQKKYVIAWILTFAFCLGLYMYNYVKPANHPDLLTFLYDPETFFLYFMVFISSPITSNFSLIIAYFVMSLINLGFGSYYLVRTKIIDFSSLLFPISIISYALFTALITTVSRSGFGLGQALSTRYIILTNLYWIVNLIIFVLLLFALYKNHVAHSKLYKVVLSFLIIIFISFTGITYLMRNIECGGELVGYSKRFNTSKSMMLKGEINEISAKLVDMDLKKISENIEFLKKNKLSLYSE